ncbi:MAG: hypothetical protein KAW61_02540, partial [candidate division Zixibacteria bacterium]|nr:hypothetical protein [candidate division Zixibacteria bacterium]
LFTRSAHDGLWLSVTVTGQPSSARRQLITVPYAYKAIESDTAGYALAGPGSGATGWVDDGSSVRLQAASDSVGIGTSSPAHKLDVDGSINTSSAYLISGDTALRIDNDGVYVGNRAGGTSEGATATCVGAFAGQSGANETCTYVGYSAGQLCYGESNTYIGADAGMHATDGEDNTYIGASAGRNATGIRNVYIGRYAGIQSTGSNELIIANSPSAAPLIWGDFVSGRVALGTQSVFAKFTVVDDGAAIHAEVNGSMGGNAVLGKANAPLGTGVKGMAMGEDGKGVYGKAEGLHGHGMHGEATLGGVGVYGDGNSVRGVGVKGVSEFGEGVGVVGSADGEDGWGVAGYANGPDGRGVYGRASHDDAIAIEAWADGLRGKAFYGKANQGGGVGIEVEAMGSSGVGLIARSGSAGLGAKIYGNVRIYSNVDEGLVMVLGEGLDYAEGFDMSDRFRTEPGTVVSIDPDNPGELEVSHIAYDTRVAGIVAGANGLGSGVRLGAGDFDLDVALAGRVYCNVEATDTAIRPGDLLTTSSVPGYAMKATDYRRAQGAILGKAMQGLDRGQKGLILVLVTLQ